MITPKKQKTATSVSAVSRNELGSIMPQKKISAKLKKIGKSVINEFSQDLRLNGRAKALSNIENLAIKIENSHAPKPDREYLLTIVKMCKKLAIDGEITLDMPI